MQTTVVSSWLCKQRLHSIFWRSSVLLLFFVQCLPRVCDVVPRLCNAFRGLVMLSPVCAMPSEGRLAPRCCAGHVTKLAVPFGPARQVTTACFYALGRHTHRRGDHALSSAEDTRTGGGTTPFLLRKTHAQARDNALSSVEGICTDRKRICTSYLVKQ